MSERPPVTYALHLGGHRLVCREVRGTEGMSQTFRFEVSLSCEADLALDADALIKSTASLVTERGGVEIVRTLDAIVTDIYVENSDRGNDELWCVLEPRFALARFRRDIRVFRDKTVPQIVAEVLGGLGVAFEPRLGSYPIRAYCVQHRETDFHFVSRLLEEEGIHYWFAAGDVMVLNDSASYDAVDGPTRVPFHHASGLDQSDESVSAFGPLARAGVSQVSLRDWNPEAPSLPMDVQAAGPTSGGPEWYDYPGEYLEPGAGQRIAELTAESYRCRADAFAGVAQHGGFGAGKQLTLEGAPQGLDGAYVLTEVTHDFHVERGGLSVRFEALDAGTVFRPLRRHEEPILPNPLTAFVTGPPGEDIHTDELGRVKVHFHWDRLQPRDDMCSDWVPVAQDNTGHSVGIPRVGWEVLVHFLEGDPDRPVVLGRVYNPGDFFEAILPRDKTMTSLQSMTTPVRDGTNVIQYQDLAGREHILVHAEKDQNLVIANDQDIKVGVDESHKVQRDETIEVGVDHTEEIGADWLLHVKGTEDISVGADRKRTDAAESAQVTGNRTLTVGSTHFRRIGTEDSQTVDQNMSETVGGAIVELSLKGNSSTANKVMATLVGGAIIEAAKGEKAESTTKARAELVGGLVLSKASKDIQTRVGKDRVTTVGAAMKVKAAKEISLNAKDAFTGTSAIGSHEGAEAITLKVGDTTVVLTEEVIKIDAKKTISFTISAQNEQGAEESSQI